MIHLTIERVNNVLCEPILIQHDIDGDNRKSIWYNNVNQQYRIYKNTHQVNESYLAETAIKYYNEITF